MTALDVWKNPSPGELSRVREVPADSPLPIAPWERVSGWPELEAWARTQESNSYEDAVSAGYDTGLGFHLALTDQDRAMFAQMLALVKEALDLGLITNEAPQTIADIDGATHTLTTLQFRQLMVGYGMYFKGIWDAAKAP